MKNLIISFLFIVIPATLVGQTHSYCQGLQIANLHSAHGDTINGDLRLESICFGTHSSIYHLKGLKGIKVITGDFLIEAEINNLEGLEDLREVGGDFKVKSMLDSINGIENLAKVGGELKIRTKTNDISPLSGLLSVGYLNLNAPTENIFQLINLRYAHGGMNLSGGAKEVHFANLVGAGKMEFVSHDLEVLNFPVLRTGHIHANATQNTKTINFPELVLGSVEIYGTLNCIADFSNLRIAENILINGMDNYRFGKLQKVTNELKIRGDGSSSSKHFKHLRYVGRLEVDKLYLGTELQFPSLKKASFIRIMSANNLISICMPALKEVSGKIDISINKSLANIDMQALTKIEQMNISANKQLKICSIDSLSEITTDHYQKVRFFMNSNFTNFCAFKNWSSEILDLKRPSASFSFPNANIKTLAEAVSKCLGSANETAFCESAEPLAHEEILLDTLYLEFHKKQIASLPVEGIGINGVYMLSGGIHLRRSFNTGDEHLSTWQVKIHALGKVPFLEHQIKYDKESISFWGKVKLLKFDKIINTFNFTPPQNPVAHDAFSFYIGEVELELNDLEGITFEIEGGYILQDLGSVVPVPNSTTAEVKLGLFH